MTVKTQCTTNNYNYILILRPKYRGSKFNKFGGWNPLEHWTPRTPVAFWQSTGLRKACKRKLRCGNYFTVRAKDATLSCMGNTRKLNFTVPDDDFGIVGNDSTLTAKQEAFAVAWAHTGNKAAAYRLAYDVGPNTAPGTMWSYASRLATVPGIVKRFREIQQQAALETIMHIREAFAWQVDIATANPNDIVYTAKRACRHCYGVGFAYQWKNDNEYMAACIVALDDKETPPSDEGGYGYTRARDPVLECPHCLGDGIPEVVLNDTSKLEGKALKLYKGMDYKNGEWVVQMHDQQKAWDMIHRMLGGYNDKLSLGLSGPTVEKLPDGAITEQEAARGYLTLLN